MLRRSAPVITLFLLAPLIAEYLLGSLPMAMIVILPIMAAMYGSGALLVREIARRKGGGWPMIAVLGLAYGVIEEGLITQSLFNPDYLHLRLLEYGYLPGLGMAIPWTLFVLTIHAVWSIAVPIGFTESLFPRRREEAWLGRIGIGGFVLVFLIGATMTAGFTYKTQTFIASPPQLGGAALAAALLVGAAFLLPRRGPDAESQRPPSDIGLFLFALVAGSGVIVSKQFGAAHHWPWPASAMVQLGVVIASAAGLIHLARGRRWTDGHRFALTAGALAVYGLFGIFTDQRLHGSADLAPHLLLVLAFAALAGFAWTRSRTQAAAIGTAAA